MKRPPVKGSALRWFLGAAKITVLLVAGLYLMLAAGCQNKMIYYPDKTISVTPEDAGLSYENAWLTTRDGVKINAWFIKNPAAINNATLLAFHGNAGNMGDFIYTLLPYYELGYNLALIDYRGFGLSGGRPGEQGLYNDAQAAWHWLTTEKKISPSNIYLLGYSLGGGVASYLAAQQPEAGGLILESTFTSLTATAKFHYPWLPVYFVLGQQYDSQTRLSGLKMPLLVMHSPYDQVVPYAFGEKLYQDYKGPKAFMALKGGHAQSFMYIDQAALKAWFANSKEFQH